MSTPGVRTVALTGVFVAGAALGAIQPSVQDLDKKSGETTIGEETAQRLVLVEREIAAEREARLNAMQSEAEDAADRRTRPSRGRRWDPAADDLDDEYFKGGRRKNRVSRSRLEKRLGRKPIEAPIKDDFDDSLVGLRMPDLPVPQHPAVARYVNYFTENKKGRSLFVKWLQRHGRYREIIAQALARHRIPADLKAVAFLESGMWPTAVSPAGATGLWQFMPATARAYGLRISRSVDERRSIWRSTEAAALHLSDLYDHFGSWDLALAAYNVGYKGVESRMRRMGAQDFWVLADIPEAFPDETARYVPKVLAIAVILNNLDHFGLDSVRIDPPMSGSELEVPPSLRLSLVARAAGTSLRQMRELNPELLRASTPPGYGSVVVHVPSAGLTRARTMLPLIVGDDDGGVDKNVSPEFDWGTEEVPADALSRLERTNRGQKPRQNHTTEPPPAPNRLDPPANPEQGQGPRWQASDQPVVFYRVGNGDTVSGLGITFGLKWYQIVRANGLRSPHEIRSGMVLRLPTTEAAIKRLSERRIHSDRARTTFSRVAMVVLPTNEADPSPNKI